MALTRRPWLVGVLGTLGVASACADPFDTNRSPPPRGTVGEELFGLVCDRVGAQALQEDLTGQSFHSVCHKDASGNWAPTVNQGLLPAADPNAVDVHGNTVSVDQQNANRTHAVARVEALARRRADLVAAVDAVFPDTRVSVKDLANPDATQSCNAPSGDGTRRLHDELTDLLGRFQGLYNDGTIPQSTESLARIFNAIKSTPDAQSSFARFEARQGYRPIELGLGVARPIIAYPNLRDLSNASLALLSSDSQAYAKGPDGKHLLVPGPANPQFNKLIEVANHEMQYATPDPTPAALKAPLDPALGRTLLSRPRTDLEVLEKVFYDFDGKGRYGRPGVRSSYITTRDPFGYAAVGLHNGLVPAPFVDKNGDGFADVDDVGLFVTSDGSVPPSPFFSVGQTYGSRDACGRALWGASAGGADGGVPSGDAGAASSDPCIQASSPQLVYQYLDVQHIFAASLVNDLKPLVNPDTTAKHETLMYALAGAPVLFGARNAAATKCYATDPKDSTKCIDPSSTVTFNGFDTNNSSLLDLVYAVGQMSGDPTMDDTLAYVSKLFSNDESSLARLTSDALDIKAIADKHPEAHIPAKSTFWDEMLDVVVKVEKEPALLEDLLKSLGADPTAQLGQIFGNYMQFRDEITYDSKNLNGPAINLTASSGNDMSTPVDRTKPDTGFNRSAMQRFLQLIHDTNGVTACNEEGAIVHARGVTLLGTADICGSTSGPDGTTCLTPIINTPNPQARPFHECEVFKIENLAKFYLQSMVGKDNLADPTKGSLYFRPGILRNGICIGSLCIGAATVDVIEQSSGIGLNANDFDGFWDATTDKSFHPRPQWLNRLVFFDQKNDTQQPTHDFLKDLNGPHIGTSVCPERVITDPNPGAADASKDGMVHGLRSCPDGDWLDQRGAHTIFVWEQFGFYKALTPLLKVFISHNREDLFLELMEVLYRHWADDKGTADECLLSSDPSNPHQQCTKDGVVTYEPILSEAFQGDILPALHDLEKTLETETIPHCTAVDASGVCTAQQASNGIAVLSAATRALVDPDQAKAIALKDRRGGVTGHRNDGTTNPQVTPIYLLLQALDSMDAAFANYPGASPTDDRLAQWRTARSQLVDQFLAIDHTGSTYAFRDTAIPAAAPTLIDVLRSQLLVHCPTTFSPPYTGRCAWARDDMTKQAANVVGGPTFAATMDVLEAVRTDAASRGEMGRLLQYLLDAASQNDALPSVLASANDILQLLKDDTNLVPLFHALAPALQASTDASQKSVVDAQLALLGRIAGRAMDTNGKEICANELDPNQVLPIALTNLVTPMKTPDGQTGLAPIQVIMDVIGDVNRGDPSTQGKFVATDYASIADNVSSFLLDEQRGLEQFYAIVRNGTHN